MFVQVFGRNMHCRSTDFICKVKPQNEDLRVLLLCFVMAIFKFSEEIDTSAHTGENCAE